MFVNTHKYLAPDVYMIDYIFAHRAPRDVAPTFIPQENGLTLRPTELQSDF